MANITYKDNYGINIPDNILKKIAKLMNFPTGDIYVVFDNKPCIRQDNFGECNPKIFFPTKNVDWDCKVLLSKKACDLKERYPAYFLYIYGHELGHAHIYLSNACLFIHCNLVEKFIKKASNGLIKKWTDLPHEEVCDKIGLYIARNIFCRDKINEEIKKRLQSNIENERLNYLLTLQESIDYKDLRERLVLFSKPYKDRLIVLWKEDKKTIFIL